MSRGPFTLDFYSAELRLAVELFGGRHHEEQGRRYGVREIRKVPRFAQERLYMKRARPSRSAPVGASGEASPTSRPSPPR